MLGFPEDQVRVLPSDDQLRLAPTDLLAAVRADRAQGRRPGFVVATAGTTNTGAVDPLPELAGLCRDEGLWLHVDGAYGAAAALSARGRRLLAGIDLADSLVSIPTSGSSSPYDLGCVLVAGRGVLEQAFRETPDYLADVTGKEGEADLRDRGLELSRRGRGLKLWLAFRTYGVRRMAAAIDRGLDLAEHAQRLIEGDARWQVVTPAQLGIVTFAPRDAGRGATRTTRCRSWPPRWRAGAWPRSPAPGCAAGPCCACAPSTRVPARRTSRSRCSIWA